MKSYECKCTGFVDNPQVKKGRANQSMPKNLVSDKFINNLNVDEVPRPNPKSSLISTLTSLMKLEMEDFATIATTSQMTTHVKGLQQNVGTTEIEVTHSNRKWNY